MTIERAVTFFIIFFIFGITLRSGVIAFLPTFTDVTALSQADIVLASALTFVALLSGLSLVAAGAAQARCYLRSARTIKYLNRCAGSIMMSAGVYTGLRG